MPLPPRLRRLPPVELHPPLAGRDVRRATLPLAGLDVRRASTPLARLRGLAGLRSLPPTAGLLLPRTRSVHTFGMRFPLDLIWLDRDGRIVRIDRDVPPRRARACRSARAVIELPATLSAI